MVDKVKSLSNKGNKGGGAMGENALSMKTV